MALAEIQNYIDHRAISHLIKQKIKQIAIQTASTNNKYGTQTHYGSKSLYFIYMEYLSAQIEKLALVGVWHVSLRYSQIKHELGHILFVTISRKTCKKLGYVFLFIIYWVALPAFVSFLNSEYCPNTFLQKFWVYSVLMQSFAMKSVPQDRLLMIDSASQSRIKCLIVFFFMSQSLICYSSLAAHSFLFTLYLLFHPCFLFVFLLPHSESFY